MKKNRSNLIIFSLFALILVGGLFRLSQNNSSNSNNSLDNKDTLVFGMELKYPPFETINSQNQPSGVSVEIAKELGRRLGKKVEIKDTAYPSLIPALETNAIDLILSSMTITEERMQRIDFSNEYAKSQLSFAYNINANYTDYNSLNDSNKTIAVKKGTVGETWVRKNLPNAKIKTFDGVGEAMLDVNSNQSQAFIYDPLSLYESKKEFSNIKIDLTPLPSVNGWGIGLRKGDDKFKTKINEEIAKMKTDGFYDKLRNEFLQKEEAQYKEYGIPFFF